MSAPSRVGVILYLLVPKYAATAMTLGRSDRRPLQVSLHRRGLSGVEAVGGAELGAAVADGRGAADTTGEELVLAVGGLEISARTLGTEWDGQSWSGRGNTLAHPGAARSGPVVTLSLHSRGKVRG